MNESGLLDDGKDMDDIENKRAQGVSRVKKFETVRDTVCGYFRFRFHK